MKKQTIKSITRNLLYRFRQIKTERFYHLIMRKNGIANKKSVGEKEWIEKWSQFGLKAKPTQYRVFSHYIGNDMMSDSFAKTGMLLNRGGIQAQRRYWIYHTLNIITVQT